MTSAAEPERLRVGPFRWAVGGLCAFIGALMLVEPHQFAGSVYTAIQPHLPIVGAGFLGAGTALLYVAALNPRAVVSIGVHAAGAGVLLLLASGFAASAAWTGTAVYGVLSLGTALAAMLPGLGGNSRGRGDLLSLVTGASGLLIGLLMLLAPGQFGAPNYDPIRADLAGYGFAFVISSLGLLSVELLPISSRATRGAHLLAGATFIVFMLEVAWPTPTGVALYGGFGIVVAIQPWLRNRLPVIDPSSLRARSALMLIAVGALPLIAAVAIVADQTEQFARFQALAQQQTLAVALAADAGDYIRLHRSAVAELADFPGLLELSAEAQHSTLRDVGVEYPDVVAFSIFDVDGSPLGRGDELALSASTGFPVYEDARRLNAPSLQVLISTLIHRPILAFGAPLRDSGGQFAGLVLETLESTRLAERITQASGGKDMLAYLVDGRGRVIAHPNAELVASFADVSGTRPVSAFLSADAPSGTLIYSAPSGEQLVGYASLSDLSWGVIVERPTSIALASVRTARELAFSVLLLFIGLAALIAVFSTRWLTRPLALLADAARRHSFGDYAAPLPASGLTEIAQLASAFRLMREVVVGRTTERDAANFALRDSEARLRHLLDGVPVGIFVMDANGSPFYANEAAQHLLGRGLEPDVGVSTFADVYHAYVAGTDQLYAIDKLPIVLALAGKSGTVDDIEIRRADGVAILVEVRASPIFDDAGAIEFAMATFSDITARKRFEMQLRENEEQLRLLVDGVRDYAIFRLTPEGVVATWNTGAERLKGYRADEIIGQHISRFYSEDDIRQRKPEEELRIAAAEGQIEDEGWRLRKDGSRFWADVVITALRSRTGQLLGFAKVTRDITERKEAEATLHASEERNRLALQAARMGTWEWDVIHDVQTWSVETEALHGLAPGSFEGTLAAFKRVVYIDDWDAVMTDMKASHGEREYVTGIYRTVWPNGLVRWLENKARATYAVDGSLVRINGTSLDITERKLAEEALQSSEERFRKQYKGIPLPTYSWLQVGDGFVLQDYNDAAEAINEHVIRVSIGTRASEYFADRPEILAAIQACAAEHRTLRRETHYRYANDEQERQLAYSFVFVPPLTVMIHREDITEAKQAEQQRKAMAQSEKLRALGQMASGIAHDLNQSLMLVASYSDLAQRALLQEPPNLEEVEDLLTTTTQAALDGGETVKRLLLFTRAAPEQDSRPVNLGSIVREATLLTAPRWRDAAQAEGRPISLQIEALDGITVQGTPSRLREMMTNLIFNAVDALPDGGAIRLRVVAENGQGIVQVTDSGLGMSAEVQARVFEPFFTTKGDHGTGLGLAMVFGIVEQHAGRIELRSAPGEGTTFSMAFPLVDQTAEVASLAVYPSEADPTRTFRVLVVDDEPMMTKAVVRMLRPSGHVVSVASSGEEALITLAEQEVDVVISDMGMGAGMNGWELAAAVKRRWPHMRFLLATGWGAAIDPIEARTRGVEAVLAKPYRPAELEQALLAVTIDGSLAA